ncbi:unnamed protein product [Symbiodinium microadriaticum]|nr:unnamed protein product [Symbiodinium microadriaticum]
MSESDEDAPWRLGPPPPLASGAADGPRPPAGPPPPRAVDSWSRLSHAYSQAVAGVINTHYATHFRGTILTYLPAELQTPFVGLQDLVVSIRPLRPHERNHPLRLHIQDDEADTVEGTETMGHHEAGTDEHPSHSAGDDIDEPAYYYADTMMPISEGEDEGPDDTAASTTAATASTRAPSSKAKAKAKAGRKPPARADGLWSLFNLLLFYAGPELETLLRRDKVDIAFIQDEQVYERRHKWFIKLHKCLTGMQHERRSKRRRGYPNSALHGIRNLYNYELYEMRQRSKQRKLDILDSAQQAANEGNAYKVWQAVKKLVPKVPRKQLQLHKHGTMMTFREELDWIVEAYGRRYGEQAQVDELPVCTVDKTQKTFSISSADLEAQLAKLNPRKAVPKGTTPSVVWKACSQIVAGPVTEAFNFLWQEETPTVAQSWADAEVALLPKSHGRSATPEARRAIVHMVMRYPQCKCPAPTDDFNNSWTRQHITKYADDTHARWMFSTYSEFEAVMQEINIVLQCFRRFHMRINLEKTKAILKVVGSLKHRVKQNFVRKFQDSRRLLLSPKNPDKWLTLVSHAEYLGAVVSYDQYELQTMRHRIQKANNRRWALASFLHSRRISVSLTEPDELEEFFGTVKPQVMQNKRRRSVEQPMLHPRNPRHSDDLVLTLAKVVVRQEEELKILKQDHSIVMWMKPGEASILNHLFQVAKAYKQKLQENPMWSPDRKTPRTVLAIAVFRELADRLSKVLNSEELLKKASDMGWRDPNTGWPFQRWNPTLKCLEKDPHRAPLSDQTIQQTLTALQQSLDADTVTRFACTRKLTETMQGMATFLMDISVRSPAAQESWNSILSLQGNTVLQLIGLAYRRETLQCGPMVNQLKEMIRGR